MRWFYNRTSLNNARVVSVDGSWYTSPLPPTIFAHTTTLTDNNGGVLTSGKKQALKTHDDLGCLGPMRRRSPEGNFPVRLSISLRGP